MKRGLHKLSVRAKLAALCAALLLLLPAVAFLQGWPTLSPEGVLRRMERQNLFAHGEVVAQGPFALDLAQGATRRGNYFLVSKNDDAYAVAVVERFGLFFSRPAEWTLNFYVSGQRPGAGPLESFTLGLGSITRGGQLYGPAFMEHAFLVLCSDPAVTRVEATESFLPPSAHADPDPYLAANGVTVACTEVASGVWQGRHLVPVVDGGGPWTALRGYGADGSLLYEVLPDPSVGG